MEEGCSEEKDSKHAGKHSPGSCAAPVVVEEEEEEVDRWEWEE